MIEIVVVICVLLPLLGGLLLSLRSRARWAAATCHRDHLLSAAAAGDENRVRETLDRGIPIDVQDRRGETALHLAYYTGQKEAVARLIAFGADENLRNREGLAPPEMEQVRRAEDLLRQGVRHLDGQGAWRDVERGRTVYYALQKYRPRIYNPALVRLAVKQDVNRTRLIHLAIKVGIPGSEQKLAEVLNGFGDVKMATDYLNAGSPILYEAARSWAAAHGYRIYRRGGQRTIAWRRF